MNERRAATAGMRRASIMALCTYVPRFVGMNSSTSGAMGEPGKGPTTSDWRVRRSRGHVSSRNRSVDRQHGLICPRPPLLSASRNKFRMPPKASRHGCCIGDMSVRREDRGLSCRCCCELLRVSLLFRLARVSCWLARVLSPGSFPGCCPDWAVPSSRHDGQSELLRRHSIRMMSRCLRRLCYVSYEIAKVS